MWLNIKNKLLQGVLHFVEKIGIWSNNRVNQNVKDLTEKTSKILEHASDEEAIATLGALLNKPGKPLTKEETGRHVAVSVLKKYGVKGEHLLVKALAQDESYFVRREAAKSLGFIPTRSAVTALHTALTSEAQDSVKMEIVGALGRVGQADSITLLQEYAANGGQALRTCANNAIQQIKTRAK